MKILIKIPRLYCNSFFSWRQVNCSTINETTGCDKKIFETVMVNLFKKLSFFFFFYILAKNAFNRINIIILDIFVFNMF